jgi:hypothetical protein
VLRVRVAAVQASSSLNLNWRNCLPRVGAGRACSACPERAHNSYAALERSSNDKRNGIRPSGAVIDGRFPAGELPISTIRSRFKLDAEFREETRSIGGQATALGIAGSFTLVVDRALQDGGGGRGFSGGQLLYLAIAGCISNDLFREPRAWAPGAVARAGAGSGRLCRTASQIRTYPLVNGHGDLGRHWIPQRPPVGRS